MLGGRIERKLKWNLATFCCALLLASCISGCTDRSGTLLPPQRIREKGYSLLLPNEPGWVIVARDQYQLALAKGGEGPDETFAIQSRLIQLPTFTSREDLMRYVKEKQTTAADLQRFKVMVFDTIPEQHRGIDCAKSYFVGEDRAAVKRTKRMGSMIFEALSLTCPHPKFETIGVEVVYSHRYYPEQKDTAFNEKAMRIMNSLEFEMP